MDNYFSEKIKKGVEIYKREGVYSLIKKGSKFLWNWLYYFFVYNLLSRGILFKWYRWQNPEPGSEKWLIIMENKYGGFVDEVPRSKASEEDPRNKESVLKGRDIGGDRMCNAYHGYADEYAKFLKPFVSNLKPVTLIEVGILKGTGVAIWSDLFEEGRILGLDIDLSHIKNNIENLKEKGAFSNENLELYKFDQFEKNEEFFSDILKGDRIDVFIDDGCHIKEGVIKTILSVRPYLAEDFVYFIEDTIKKPRPFERTKIISEEELRKYFPDSEINNYGQMMIVKNK